MAALGMTAVSLQGCGGGAGVKATTTTVATSVTTTTSTSATTTTLGPLPPQSEQLFVPIKSIWYQAWPTTEGAQSCKDLMQVGYKEQFHTLRDDLGLIRSMGASSVRVSVGLGSELKSSHAEFLDRASELGLGVIVDFYTNSLCDDFDCYGKWKDVTAAALEHQGFKRGGGWHPAVKLVMLMDRPDGLAFTTAEGPAPVCPKIEQGGTESQPWCRVKAALSAFDGFLKAESEAGVSGGNVSVGISWTFTLRPSIHAGDTTPTEMYGFLDMQAGIASPGLAKGYSFKSSNYKQAYEERWVNAIDSSSPWSYIKEKINDKYEALFGNQKLFISSLTPTESTEDLAQELESINAEASKGGFFLGVVVNGFMTDLDGTARMFTSGKERLATSAKVCQEDPHIPAEALCYSWSMSCLEVAADSGTAKDVAAAWGGEVGPAVGLCQGREESAGDATPELIV